VTLFTYFDYGATHSNSKVLEIEFDGNDTWRITTVKLGLSSDPDNGIAFTVNSIFDPRL
jgi:hypothetical protein